MVEATKKYWAQASTVVMTGLVLFMTVIGMAAAGQRPIRLSTRRGAGFMEYALIALVAIGVFGFFKKEITAFMTDLWVKIYKDSEVK